MHILPFEIATALFNRPPYFLIDLPPIVSTIAAEGQFDLGLTMPETFDPDNDNVKISIEFGQLESYLVYDATTKQIRLNSNVSAGNVPLGFFMIFIQLTDDSPLGSLSTNYQIAVDI